jgi:hypothetical protein
MLPFMLALLLEVRSSLHDPGLSTAAQSSPRPRECRGSASGSEGLWGRLRGSDVERYCLFLARGYARLSETPGEALLAARAAEALVGPSPAVRVLSGRAQLRLDQPVPAYQQFASAEVADADAFRDPQALHDFARAASLARESAAALRLYRLLASRVALLPGVRERVFSEVEAAAHVLAFSPGAEEEALGYLAQARREPLGLSGLIDALRWLALEQSGRHESGASKPSLGRLGLPGVRRGFSVIDGAPLLPDGQGETLRALLSRSAEPVRAREGRPP